ncbi:MAG: glycosyltransferase [Bacteroidota bacterium]
MKTALRILVAPLNWGLGHATRCIPIIQELQRQGASVVLASDGRAARLLSEEFPQLPLFELPSYNISYPSSSMVWNMALQLPAIAWAVRSEQRFVRKLAREQQLDAIISDNRYGCYVKGLPCVCLTHQLRIKMPWSLLEGPVAWVNRFQLRHFKEIWVPDNAGAPNLSGELSHDMPSQKIRYIGPLSRLQCYARPLRYDVLLLLSGPEPQRSRLEAELLEQAKGLPKLRFLIVQGKTESYQRGMLHEHIEQVSFLTSSSLNDAMLESRLVVSRSGYSTLMDLAALGKSALLIPTPGQTEQEYLAEHFGAQGYFIIQRQGQVNLKQAVDKAAGLRQLDIGPQPRLLARSVKELLTSANLVY